MKCPTCGRRMPGTRDDMLDDIYFSLPIRHGDGFLVAEALGITHGTLRRGLKKLMAEGLASQPRRGYYMEGNDTETL